MARRHGLGLLMLLAGCSLDTGPNATSIVSRTATPAWSPSRRPSAQQPQVTAMRDSGGADAAMPDRMEDPEPVPPKAADTNPSPIDAGAHAEPIQPPAANAGSRATAEAGNSHPAAASAAGNAADSGSAGSNANGPKSGNAPAPGMSAPGKQARDGKNDNGHGSRKHSEDSDDGDKHGRGDDKRAEPQDTDASALTSSQDGTLSLLFTSVSNLVFSILQFSFGPAQPANITNLIVSIVTLAALPASEVTTATLSELLEQLDASNVCHDDHSACETLCETLIASCDLYKSDPRSVQSVERNCGSKSLAACK